MEHKQDERWMTLCKQAAQEKDPERLLKLVREINQILQTKAAQIGVVESQPNRPKS